MYRLIFVALLLTACTVPVQPEQLEEIKSIDIEELDVGTPEEEFVADPVQTDGRTERTFHYEGESLTGDIGVNIGDASAGEGGVRFANEGEEGFLSVGPYNTDLVGTGESYTATFSLKIGNNTTEENVAVIDVVTGSGGLAGLELVGTDFPVSGKFHLFVLEFESPREGSIEFRTKSTGVTSVALDWIEIR